MFSFEGDHYSKSLHDMPMQAQRGSVGIAPSNSHLRRSKGQQQAAADIAQGKKNSVPVLYGTGWDSGAFLDGQGTSRLHRDRGHRRSECI